MSTEATVGLTNRVDALEKQQIRMSMEQERTNEILMEFRDDVKSAFKWLFSLIGTTIVVALLGLIFKGAELMQPKSAVVTTTTTHSP